MKRKMFCVWLAVAGIIFAALTLGGCGVSHSEVEQAVSDDDPENVPNAATVIQDDEMSKVEAEALDALAEEMLRDGTLFKIA